MSTQSQKQAHFLQEVCEQDSVLTETKDIVEQDNVVMHRDGSLAYAKAEDKISRLRRRRKEMVLGLNGFEQHELEEANEVITSARSNPVDRLKDFFKRRKV